MTIDAGRRARHPRPAARRPRRGSRTPSASGWACCPRSRSTSRTTRTVAARRPRCDLPVVVNGQILPRDVDRFRFRAKKGQRLVVRAEARGLVPYQADSVPGWMQATLTLRDATRTRGGVRRRVPLRPGSRALLRGAGGRRRTCSRSATPSSRGREDFVYRDHRRRAAVRHADLPARRARRARSRRRQVDGWNLHWRQVPLDTRARRRRGAGDRVATGPGRHERRGVRRGQPARGRRGRAERHAGAGARGDARRASSTARSVTRATWTSSPSRGVAARSWSRRSRPAPWARPWTRCSASSTRRANVVAWNDDFVHEGLGVRGLGLQTHHADSYLTTKLPKSGTYRVRVTDVRRHGGDDHAYRLRISTPRPDVQLFVSPSSINVPFGPRGPGRRPRRAQGRLRRRDRRRAA